MTKQLKFAAAALLLVAACAESPSGPSTPTTPPPPTPPAPVPTDTVAPVIAREMRGLWIATVANIDWPSSSSLSAVQQRAELVDIFDRAVAAGLNTIVLHVRPAADALYESQLEPWGLMLTGVSGQSPGYDPLAFAIAEAHKRGLELHAWINPFRAGNTRDSLKFATNHVYNAKSNLVRTYGSNLWLDPGDPASQDHSMAVIRDIVTRYDIDGLHADDYFYPYQVNGPDGKILAFPDDSTYARYGNGMARDDWRRDNINRFVQRMYNEVHAIKPTVKVGISPFGIWRPNNPPGVQGLDAYASIYADSRKWLQNGWLDYFAPQLYWAITAPQQSYPALLDWWIAQNTMNRHIWPGLAAYRVNNGTSSAFTLQEIPDQIALTRARAGSTGNLLYNATWTLKNNSAALASALAANAYKTPALVPASPWLDASAPPAPSVTVQSGALTITAAAGETPRWWVVRMHRSTGGWSTLIRFADATPVALDNSVDRVVAQAVDQAGNISGNTEWRR